MGPPKDSFFVSFLNVPFILLEGHVLPSLVSSCLSGFFLTRLSSWSASPGPSPGEAFSFILGSASSPVGA